MWIENLTVKNLRIIEQSHLKLSSGINFFIGENGTGKTSLLEAISILSQGRSFKTNRIERVVKEDADQLMVMASYQSDQHIGTQHIGIEKKKDIPESELTGRMSIHKQN